MEAGLIDADMGNADDFVDVGLVGAEMLDAGLAKARNRHEFLYHRLRWHIHVYPLACPSTKDAMVKESDWCG